MSVGKLCVCVCVCVLCVAERHSAGLHFSDKRWWVSAERALGGRLECDIQPGAYWWGGGTRHPSQPFHPSPTTAPTLHLHPATLHFWVEKWELLHGGWLCLMPRSSLPSLPLSPSCSYSTGGLQNRIRHQIRLSAPLDAGIEHLASCRLRGF